MDDLPDDVVTTPVKIHYENPQSPQNTEYPDGEGYEDAKAEAEGAATEQFKRAKEQSIAAASRRFKDGVTINLDASFAGCPATSLDFITIVLEVNHYKHTAPDELRQAVEEAGRATDFTVQDVGLVEPTHP